MKRFRVIDTGIRDGRRQIAFDQAMIDAHKDGAIPDTIRFLRFPPTALVGRHQAISREVRVEHCRTNGIGITRRITGGGAIYFDEGQLGWELVFSRATLGIASLAELARVICEAAAAGLCRLGIDARLTRLNIILGVALSVGAATAITGVIGFVGLMVPHALRPWVGHRPGLLLPASLLGGASLLLLADIALRLVQPWADLRIGVLTALFGAPFFLWLVLKTRRELAP